MLLGWPEVRLGETRRLLLGFDTALLVWRLGMRSYFTTRCYGWRQGLLALPRAFVANIIAMFAARRAVHHYCPMLRPGEVVWDQTAPHQAEAPARPAASPVRVHE